MHDDDAFDSSSLAGAQVHCVQPEIGEQRRMEWYGTSERAGRERSLKPLHGINGPSTCRPPFLPSLFLFLARICRVSVQVENLNRPFKFPQ